jgi:hypothetical protein
VTSLEREHYGCENSNAHAQSFAILGLRMDACAEIAAACPWQQAEEAVVSEGERHTDPATQPLLQCCLMRLLPKAFVSLTCLTNPQWTETVGSFAVGTAGNWALRVRTAVVAAAA